MVDEVGDELRIVWEVSGGECGCHEDRSEDYEPICDCFESVVIYPVLLRGDRVVDEGGNAGDTIATREAAVLDLLGEHAGLVSALGTGDVRAFAHAAAVQDFRE